MNRDYPLFPFCLGVLVALLGSACFSWGQAYGAVGEPSRVQLQRAFGKLPLHFIPNQGQTDERVKYYTQGGGYAFFFTPEGVVATQTGENITKKAVSANKGGGSRTNIDAFVTKIRSDGRALLYSVRLGGSNNDYGFGIAVDAAGCAYVTGGTSSSDFPITPNHLAGKGGGRDVFVTKLNPLGNGAVFSTYLPGNDDEEGFAIAVDGFGCAYVTGYTYSTDFSTPNAFQSILNRDPGNVSVYDAFVTKISDIPAQ